MPVASSPISVEQTGGEIVIRVRTEAASVGDELVAVERAALAKLELEYAPIVALAQAGTLRTVWIGRRRYTKRSWLVALADALPSATDVAATDDIARAAAKRAAYIETHGVPAAKEKVAPANDADPEAMALSRVGARRVSR